MKEIKRKKYTADFETTTNPEDCHVWAWGVCEIGDKNKFVYGNNITTFFEFCQRDGNFDIYFHNLKFDGEFILYYLLKNGYKYIENRKDRENKTFTTLISDLGQFYMIEIFFEVGNKKLNSVKIMDSLKILNMSVLEVAKSFGLGELAEKIKEEKIDYEKERKEGYEINAQELIYLKNDVEVMAIALNQIFSEGLTKMTQGSNALNDYKNIIKEDNFDYYFPVLDYDIDHEIRKSYKGGFCYVNPENQEKIIHNLMILDVNSLYPSVMYYNLLPVGQPVYYEGKYEYDKFYPLYIQCFSCSFELKKGKLPTYLSKKSYKNRNEYVVSSNGEIEILVMTSVDMDLFFKHYDVYDLKFINGYKIQGKLHLFDKYIDKWSSRKIESKKIGNHGMYLYSKVMLNSLYGKFGLNPDGGVKEPYLNEEEIVKYKTVEGEKRKTIYIPMASFITSYARKKTIETSQKIKDFSIEYYGKDYYCYSDTDSIHMKHIDIDLLKNIIEIDPYKLGAWDLEGEPDFGKFIRQKSYIEYINGQYKITCAGMSKSCIKYNENKDKVYYKIFDENECKYKDEYNNCNGCKYLGNNSCFWKEFNINDFKVGFFCGGKLGFKHVPGGVILQETSFLLKEKF